MNQLIRAHFIERLQERVRGVFNLNDPRWGRGEDKSDNERRPDSGSEFLNHHRVKKEKMKVRVGSRQT